MKFRRLSLSLLFIFGVMQVMQVAAFVEFSDIDPTDSFNEYLQEFAEAKIANGFDNGTFRKDKSISRAEAVQFVLANKGQDPKQATIESDNNFTDMNSEDWFYNAILLAVDQKLIQGYPDQTVRGKNTISLVEALKIILADEDLDEIAKLPYLDADPDAWYGPIVDRAVKKGMVSIGYDRNLYPSQKLTREDFIILMYKFNHPEIYAGETHVGKATYYGAAFHGRTTASGGTFDMNALTAAHRTLPFGTQVVVTNKANDLSVIVEINDRGPYGHGRIIDLSKFAFEQIGYAGSGVLNVEVKVLEPDDKRFVIEEKAHEVLKDLEGFNTVALSEHIHPTKGLRFSPHTTVLPNSDIVISKEEMLNLNLSTNRMWGYADGSGFEINMPFTEFINELMLKENFLNADTIKFNKRTEASSNSTDNLRDIYPNGQFIEYFVNGTGEFASMNWGAIRLVFEMHNDEWYIVGIIRDQWSI